MRIGRPRWFGLLLWAGLLAISGCTGCHQDAWIPEQSGPQGPTTQDLLEFQRNAAEKAALDRDTRKAWLAQPCAAIASDRDL